MQTRNVQGQFQEGTKTSNPEERFWAKVDKTPSCWLWTGFKNGDGYGTFYISGCVEKHNRKQMKAHRFAYELLVGPIPVGLIINHLCHNTACVNPIHLELMTNQTNAGKHIRHCPTCTCVM